MTPTPEEIAAFVERMWPMVSHLDGSEINTAIRYLQHLQRRERELVHDLELCKRSSGFLLTATTIANSSIPASSTSARREFTKALSNARAALKGDR